MLKFIPVEDALVVRVGSVQDFRDRLADANVFGGTVETEPEQSSREVLASIRDMIPGIAKVPTIREAFCP